MSAFFTLKGDVGVTIKSNEIPIANEKTPFRRVLQSFSINNDKYKVKTEQYSPIRSKITPWQL